MGNKSACVAVPCVSSQTAVTYSSHSQFRNDDGTVPLSRDNSFKMDKGKKSKLRKAMRETNRVSTSTTGLTDSVSQPNGGLPSLLGGGIYQDTLMDEVNADDDLKSAGNQLTLETD